VEALQERFGAEPRVWVLANAVSNTDSAAKLYFDEPGSGLASLCKRDLREYGIELGSSEEVKAIRLDQYIEQQGVAHVHFIKLDIEGHEPAALEGMGRYLEPGFVDFVQFEYGGANLDSHTTLRGLFSIFRSRGFTVAKVMKNCLEVREYEVWMENYRYSNYVAIADHLIGALR
jgi:FkbM family methyltransferase